MSTGWNRCIRLCIPLPGRVAQVFHGGLVLSDLLNEGAWRRSSVITVPIGGNSPWLARIDSGVSRLIEV